MPETTEKTAQDFNTFVESATPEQLTSHIQQCMEEFCRVQVPTAEMVDEVTQLSLAIRNEHQFLLIVNGYLQKLNQLEVKAGYHLSGYARILIHSLEARDQIGLSKGMLEQVCCSFITLWSGVCLKMEQTAVLLIKSWI